MIERFLIGMEAMLGEPDNTEYVAVVLPGDLDPFERHYRFGIHLDAELRLVGLGTCGGGGSVSELDDDDEWRTAYSIIDMDLVDMDRGRALVRAQLIELDCPVDTMIQYRDLQDRWDGGRWHLGEDRSFDEDKLEGF